MQPTKKDIAPLLVGSAMEVVSESICLDKRCLGLLWDMLTRALGLPQRDVEPGVPSRILLESGVVPDESTNWISSDFSISQVLTASLILLLAFVFPRHIDDFFFFPMRHERHFLSQLSFQSNLPDDVFENGTAATEKRPLSFTFGDLPYEDRVPPANPAEPSSAHVSSSPDITTAATQHRALKSSESSSPDCSSSDSCGDAVPEPKDLPSPGEAVVTGNKVTPRARSEVCQKPSDAGSDRVFIEANVPVSLLQDTDEGSELKPVELDTYEGNITKQLVKRLTSAEVPGTPERLPCEGSISGESEGYKSYLDGSIEEALQGLLLVLEPHKEQYKEFQDLDQEVMHLDDILKVSTFSESTTLKDI